MKKYDVIIIGAGIGGLTAGAILAKNGKKVLILEKNPVPGGAVTTFYRNGYPIDITHSVCGLGREAFLGKIFDYLGIYQNLSLIEMEKAFVYLRSNDKKPISCYTDIQKYKEELNTHFPSEKNNINRLFNTMEEIWDKEVLNCYYDPSFFEKLLYPLHFPGLYKFRNCTFLDILNKYTKNNELKDILAVSSPYLGEYKEDVSGLYMICAIMAYHKEKTYFVKGGYGQIAKILESRFLSLGGTIQYNTIVESLLLKNSTECYGINDKKGNQYFGDNVVSNIDGKKSFLNLIGKKNLPPKVYAKISNYTMSRSIIQVHLIVEAQINKEFLNSGSIVFHSRVDLENSIRSVIKSEKNINKNALFVISVHPLSNFQATQQENLFVINVAYWPTDFALWKNIEKLGNNCYKNIKDEIAVMVCEEIKNSFSINNVRFSHVFTPLSYERWLNSTEGSIYDIACTPKQTILNRFKNKTYMKNYFLVGASTFPGTGIAGTLCSAVFLSDIFLD